MKSFVIVLSLFTTLLVACGNQDTATKETPKAEQEAFTGDSVLMPNFYKRIEGTIAGKPIVMHLHCINGQCNGSYYYTDIGQWIMLSAVLDKNNGNSLTLTELSYSDGEKVAVMQLAYKLGNFKGTWTKSSDNSTQDVDLKEAYPAGSYQFTTLALYDSVKAYPSSAESPMARVSKAFVLPTTTDADGAFIATQIKDMLAIDSAIRHLDVAEGATKMNGKYIKAYNDEVKELGGAEHVAFLNYDESNNVSVCFNEHGIVIFESAVYAYTGGAHGNGGSRFYCLDVVNKKRITLQDIIIVDSATLQPIVESHFRKQYKLAPTDSLTSILFENHLALTDNFYFTNKGIGFWYFPYEVAAYAVGPIQVFVPFAAIRKHINSDFANRMRL